MTRNLVPQNSVLSATPLLLVLLIWSGLVWFSHLRYQPPPIVPADALRSTFSAERAESIFQRLYQDAQPHPAGQNEAFREKVIGEFKRLGYEVELHRTSDSPRNRRSDQDSLPLVNLIVRLVGKTDKPPVMLCAHYDSVPYGPGAADDGVGLTALLEIARMLRDEPPLDRTVIFLVTDGEEMGLLGARRFVDEHPLASKVATVINLEARGTKGPSIMFETSEDSEWLVELFARSARKPFASSLFFEIYRFLPNDTDFTIFRLHGIRGFNFAFIGDVKNYHTPGDNLDNVDRRSLQHHGENALPLVRRLAQADIESENRQAAAVYFDVLGFFIMRWPAGFSIWLSIAGLILVLIFSRWRDKQEKRTTGKSTTGSVIVSVLLVTVSMVTVALMGKLMDTGLRMDNALEHPWPDQPVPIQASYWLFGLTVLLALAWLAGKRLDWRPSWYGVWLIWSALAIITSTMIAGGSYLFIVPLLGTGMAILMTLFVGEGNHFRQAMFVSCFGAVAVAVVWMPIERIFYDAVGFRINMILVIRVAIASSALIPVMALTSRKALGGLTVVSLLGWTGLVLWGVIAN